MLKIVFLFSLASQTFFAFSEDEKCQKKFTVISSSGSSEEILSKQRRDISVNMHLVIQALKYMEKPTPEEHPLRNIKLAMMDRDGSLGMAYSSPSGKYSSWKLP